MNTVFEQVSMGPTKAKNRLVMAPVKTAFGSLQGTVTDKLIAYYMRRAQGGVGAIIVEPLFVDPAGKEHPKQLGIDADDKIEGLSRLVDAIHAEGALAIAHVNHAGRAANPKASGQKPEAPSSMVCNTTGATSEEMTLERIKEIVSEFAAAARRARQAGFDAVELQTGLGYLVSQFLSPRTNHRKDDYGGSKENRLRFLSEVVAAMQSELGDEVALTARMSATEQTEGGLTIDDGKELAQWLQEHGVSALHVVSGSACDSPPWYYQHMAMPPGANAKLAREIRSAVQIPVVAAGRMGDPAEIEQVIGNGWADLVALGRPLVADPDLPRKMKDSHPELVLQCGGCLQGCLMGVKSGAGIQCIVNPELGLEGEPVQPATEPKSVLVVGGGPAGLTAARTAAERGHRVTLLERNEETLGGQFALAHLAPGKQAMKRTLDSLIRIARQSGAAIRTGEEAQVDRILADKPEVVVVATGAVPAIPKIPGMDHPLTGEDVLTKKVKPGHKVLVIGGGLVGIETAEFLAEQGHEVTVVEMLGDIARDMEPIMRKITMLRLPKLPITILTETLVEAIEGSMAKVKDPSGTRTIGPFDSVVVAVGTRSDDSLSDALRQAGLEVHIVGDASDLGQIFGAVQSAWKVARAL